MRRATLNAPRYLLWILLLHAISALGDARTSKVIHSFHLDELNQQAPEFSILDPHGKKSTLRDYRGKAILLHFWASWCMPCQKELPDLKRLSSKLDPKHWVFLAVSADDSKKRESALRFLGEIGMKEDFHEISDSKAAEKYLTWGLPVTYVISPSGEIVARALGQHEWNASSSDAQELNGLFSEPPKTSK